MNPTDDRHGQDREGLGRPVHRDNPIDAVDHINRLLDFGLRCSLNGDIDNWWDYYAMDAFADSTEEA